MNKRNKRGKQNQRLGNKEQIDSDQKGREKGVTGERKGKARKRTQIEDSWTWTMGRIDCGSGKNGGGESNGEKGGTTVTEQQ